MEAGDLIAHLRLDNKQFKKSFRESEQHARASFGMTEKVAKETSKQMGESMEKFAKRSIAASKKAEKGWWATFGRVAVGFTVAYRAMNALETGLRKYVDTTLDAIRESGELAGIQAKLAFWYKMHSESVISYSDAFSKAAVNTRALMKANLTAISSLEELSTGLDEVAQSVGAVPAKLIPALADVVDFTVMVAQTTGSTIRQVRQELQALMQGQVRTTNILIRALKNLRVLTDEDISNLKAMTNRAEIFEKVLMAISEHWSKVREQLISTDVTIAMRFWEKSIRATLTRSVQLASEIEHVGNIFANEFAVRGRKAASVLEDDVNLAMERNIVLMQELRDVLALGLDLFEGITKVAGLFATAIHNLSEPLETTAKILGGYLAFSAVEKLLRSLGKVFLWLATGPMKIFLRVANSIYARFLAIPAVIAASAIAIEVLLDMLKKKMPDAGKKTKNFFSDMADKTKEATDGWIDLKGTIQLFPDAWEYWKKAFGKAKLPDVVKEEMKATGEVYEKAGKKILTFAETFGKQFTEKAKSHFKVLLKFLDPLIKDIHKQIEGLFKPPALPFDWEQYLSDTKGLGWAMRIEWDKETKDILEKGSERWFKAYAKLQKDINRGIQAAERYVDRWEEKLKNVVKTSRDVAKEQLMILSILIEQGKISKETGELIEKTLRKKFTGGITLDIGESFKGLIDSFKGSALGFKDAVQEASTYFVASITGGAVIIGEAIIGILDALTAFVNLPARIFDAASSLLDAIMNFPVVLAEAVENFAEKLTSVISTLARTIIPSAVSITKSAFSLLNPKNWIKGFFGGGGYEGPTYAEVWRGMRKEIEDLFSSTTKLEDAIEEVNNKFNEWINSIKSFGVKEEELTKIENLRAEAIQRLIDTQKEQIEESIIDRLLKVVAPEQATYIGIIRDFAEIVEQLRNLSEITGEGYEDLIDLAEASFAQELRNAVMQTDAIRDLKDSLTEWQRILVRIRDQILGIQISLASPADVFERMASLEEEIASYLGAGWLQGTMDATDLTAEEAEKVRGYLGDYLKLGQEAWQRPSNEYQALYDVILISLGELESVAENIVSEYELQYGQLNELLRGNILLEGVQNLLSQGLTFEEAMATYLAQISSNIMAGIPVDVTVDLSGIFPEVPSITEPISAPIPEVPVISRPEPTPWPQPRICGDVSHFKYFRFATALRELSKYASR